MLSSVAANQRTSPPTIVSHRCHCCRVNGLIIDKGAPSSLWLFADCQEGFLSLRAAKGKLLF